MNIARMLAKATRPLRSGREPRHPDGAEVSEVDVREDLRLGREPLSRIMAAVEELGSGHVLRVRAIFEPVPLFRVLGKRGFEYEAEQHGPDDWSVWFWRREADEKYADLARDGSPPVESSTFAPQEEAPAAATDEAIWLDVRDLKPPEPLMRTLAALDVLPTGKTLVQVHNRIPQLLFPLLAERGFACDVDEHDPERILVRIWRSQ